MVLVGITTWRHDESIITCKHWTTFKYDNDINDFSKNNRGIQKVRLRSLYLLAIRKELFGNINKELKGSIYSQFWKENVMLGTDTQTSAYFIL